MSSNKTLQFNPALSFGQLVQAITAFAAETSILIASEPGVGKSSLLPAIAEYHGDKWRKPGDFFPDDKYIYVYVDCPMMDFADFGMRIPSHDTKTLEFYTSSLFHMGDPRPKVIMFDERFKALKALQPMFTRADLERTIGDIPLPKGSMVFSTTNNASDGVGDTVLAHSANRLMQVQMRKPTVDEWCAWATEAGLDAKLRTAVKMNPLFFQSYRDGFLDNDYIFKPNLGSRAFASPRSLAKCDVVMRNLGKLSEPVAVAALSGLVGDNAAQKLYAVAGLVNDTTPPDEIFADPNTARLPGKAGGVYMTIFTAIDRVQVQDDLTALVTFVKRLGHLEYESLFYSSIMRNPKKKLMGNRNNDCRNWASANLDLLNV